MIVNNIQINNYFKTPKTSYKSEFTMPQAFANNSDCFVRQNKTLTFGSQDALSETQKYIDKFGIGEINLVDKKTKEPIKGIITKEALEDSPDFLNQIQLRIYTNNELAGQLFAYDIDMKPSEKMSATAKLFANNTDFYNDVKTQSLTALKAECLESYKGNEIKGIGKGLIIELIKESFNRGHEGKLLVAASNTVGIYGYRPNTESPIPFYWNEIGLRANKKLDKEIGEAMKIYNSQKELFLKGLRADMPAYSGPEKAYMFLPTEVRKQWRKILFKSL